MKKKRGRKKNSQNKNERKRKLKQVSDLTVCFSNFTNEVDVSQRTKKTHHKNLNQIKKVIYHLKNDNKLIRKPRCSLCIINSPLTDIFKNNINV